MSASPSPAPAAKPNLVADILLWLLLALAAFTVPRPPALELDASWRMTMGYAFAQGLQWGTDLVFTYGPLGFVMGKTYWGQLFWGMIAWQAFQAALAATLFVAEGRRLAGVQRFAFFAAMVLFGVVYEDALEMIVIVLLGWQLLRWADEDEPRAAWPHTALLALYGAVKFTNLLLAGVAVAAAVVLALLHRRTRVALVNAATFAGTTLLLWVLCGQNPLNLPAYLLSCLEFSGGYTDGMSIPTPDAPFRTALIVAGLVAVGFILQLVASPRRKFTLAATLFCAAFLFLNWKHGFVRADGHMIGFFICALLPITAFPALFGEGLHRWLRWLLFVPAGLLCVVGIDQALPGMARGIVGQMQNHLWTRAHELTHWQQFRQGLRDQMHQQRLDHDLHFVRNEVGTATLDVLGFEQAIALFNKFNYRPRPVFQSYCAFSAPLAQRNLDYYASPRAPQYALVKLQAIDNHLPAMDDARLLNYFVHAYDYVLTDKDWQLWRRRPDAPPAERVAPRRLRTTSVALRAPVELGELSQQPLWVTVDLRPSLLGRIRGFLYKQPLVFLVVEDTAGATSRYRMPPAIGRGGFLLNPLIENLENYLNAAGGGGPVRRVAKLFVDVEGDEFCFQSQAEIGLFAVTPAEAGLRYRQALERAKLAALGRPPTSIQSYAPPAEGRISGQPVLVIHAPSRVEYELPAGATTIRGRFGYLPAAYEGDARTGGAEFRVVWSDGTVEHTLFSRFLDPRENPADRGLHSFSVPLAGVTGRIYLVIDAGSDNGWDWTAWTGVEIR